MERTRNDWLDGIDIASPCSADWNEMAGDDRCRFCSQCSLHVFDLSSMTRSQAEDLVASRTGGRLCVRFTRRADGTVLTRDCPVGLRQRLRNTASRLVAMCVAAFAFLGCRGEPRETPAQNPQTETPRTRTPDAEPPVLQGAVVMGEMEMPEQIMGRIATIPPEPEKPPAKR